MATNFITEEHMGPDYTREDALTFVRIMQNEGYLVRYGAGLPWRFKNANDRECFESAFDTALLELERRKEAQVSANI